MSRLGSLLNLLLILLAVGCRLPGRDNPVPQSLLDCRRLSQQGVAALDRGQTTEAERLLEKAIAACPTDSEAHRHHAEALWQRGARPEAIAQLEEASRLAGEDAASSTRLAEMYLACGRVDDAAKKVQRVLDLEPKSAAAWAIRAGIMRAANRPEEALADNLRALGYAPHDRQVLQQVATLYQQLNQPQRALQTLQTLAETYSPGEEPAQVLSLLGGSYLALGRYDEAIHSLTIATARADATADMYCQLGEAEMLAGHPLSAASAARQALAKQPRHEGGRALLERIETAQRPKGSLWR